MEQLAYVNHTIINFLQDETILVVEQIYGLMLVEVEQCSALLDHTVPQPLNEGHVIAGITV